MIDRQLHLHLKINKSYTNLYYGSAEHITPPYYVMRKISDPEESTTLCDISKETGKALFQFSCFVGGEGVASDPSQALLYLNILKNDVKSLKGLLLVTGKSEQYKIWYNSTTGCTLISDGENSLQRWGAIFETILYWEKIA